MLLAGQWIIALFGSIFATCSDLNSPTTTIIELVMFLIMGFGLVVVWPFISTMLSPVAFQLLLAGGAAYVVGIVFFIMGEWKPIFHTIWHLFVVLGASLHWFDIYFYVASTHIHSPTDSIIGNSTYPCRPQQCIGGYGSL